MAHLLDPETRDGVFALVTGEHRYLAPVARSRGSDFLTNMPKALGEVVQISHPGSAPAYLVFAAEKDADGRSAFVLIRGDGRMLPGLAGEQWRMSPGDLVDLDGDGAVELMVDCTMRGGETRVGALRVLSLTVPSSDHWALLYRHRAGLGGWSWQLRACLTTLIPAESDAA